MQIRVSANKSANPHQLLALFFYLIEALLKIQIPWPIFLNLFKHNFHYVRVKFYNVQCSLLKGVSFPSNGDTQNGDTQANCDVNLLSPQLKWIGTVVTTKQSLIN